MKLNWFVCALLFMGGCQKTPTKPVPKTLLPSTPSSHYSNSIQAAYNAKSMSKLIEVKKAIERSNGNEIHLAFAFRRIGNLYSDLRQPDSAIHATKTALGILQKSLQRNPSDSAKCQLNIGVYYLLANYSLDSAKAYLESALFTFKKLGDSSSIFNAQNNLIRLYTQLGDYEQATIIEKGIQSLEHDPKISDNVRKDWHSNLGLKSLHLFEVEEDTSKLSLHKQKILFHYNKAISYLAQKDTMNPNIAAMLINISAAYIHSKDFYNAEKVLNQALLISKQANDIVNEAKCLLHLALCSKNQAPAIAKQLLLNADKLFSKLYNNKSSIYRTEIYSNLGNLDFEQKKYLKAAENYQKAIEHACSGNKDYLQQLAQQKEFNFNAPKQLLYPLQHKAESLFQQYLLDKKVHYLAQSLKIYETLDDYITRTRGLMTADESKYAYSEKVVSVYENALLTSFTAYRLDSTRYADYIIRFMAHSKAAVLQESVQQDRAKQLANITPQALEEEKKLRWEVAKAQKALSESLRTSNAYKNLLEATEKWDTFIQQLEKQYPIYYHSKYAGLKTLTISQLQQNLKKDRAVIDFFWGQKTLYTTTMTHNHFQVDSMTISPTLQPQMESWVNALDEYIVNDSIIKIVTQYSHIFYQQLLEKPLQNLPPQNKIQRLTIIPDGILNHLPFEALSQKPIQHGLKKDTSATLIWKYAISYAYSNTLLFGAPKRNTAAIQEFGGFGINYNKNKYITDGVDKKAIGRLRNAEDDVRKSKKLFKCGNIWTESAENAYLESFYKNAPDCRILYLSMHGVLNDSFPLESGLIFTKKDSLQMLQLSDIQGIPLPYNDLTILSACKTSLGKLRHGEGSISLSRAFSFTGTRSLLTTRWSLNENAGSAIIDPFLQYIKQGEPKDIALQKAKQFYLNTHQSSALMPNFWAATVLVGDIEPLSNLVENTEPLSLSHANSYWIWIMMSFIVLPPLIWRLRKR